jgi:hypothetical protein
MHSPALTLPQDIRMQLKFKTKLNKIQVYNLKTCSFQGILDHYDVSMAKEMNSLTKIFKEWCFVVQLFMMFK